nr:MAG TPA: hypothetical protein [Caudoviricetes sp.]
MTEKDKELIRKAKSYTYFDWYKVCDLEKVADTEEAKSELKNIKTSLYHEEEWYAGLL